ncbi:RAMP superfamily CRISPR-associated protein [Endothiovibrio diazotrophicus]
MDSKDTCRRIWIHGTLTCDSPLHVGDGEERLLKERESREERYHDSPGRYLTLYGGLDDLPRIPASTLRGSLRAAFGEEDGELFGYARGESGRAGALRLFDATPRRSDPPPCHRNDGSWSEQRRTILHHGVSLDPRTGTAKDHHLFTFELFPAGTRFDVAMELHPVGGLPLHSLLDRLLERFTHWNGGLDGAIGRGRGHGWGRVSWSTDRIRGLTEAGLRRWLDEGGPIESDSFTERLEYEFPQEQREMAAPVQLVIRPDGPLLVNAPTLVSDEEGEAKLVFLRDAGDHAVIPASTLRGLVRGRARRILATIAHRHFNAPADKAGEQVDPLVMRLFGDEGRRGTLSFGDARSEKKAEPHHQFFNAIDRFTGGVADGALYQVEAANCDLLRGDLRIDHERLPDDPWWKGLLLLIARDAMDGALAVGWGKARGFGAFRLAIEHAGERYDDVAEALGALERAGESPRQWVEALHRRIERQLKGETDEEQAA